MLGNKYRQLLLPGKVFEHPRASAGAMEACRSLEGWFRDVHVGMLNVLEHFCS